MKKVELLSPAGSYEGFIGALHAGADAVYLGGRKFGARAYADNFSEEEICDAVHYAHLYGKKVYLTLNTLIKEREFPEIYDYLYSFYLAGLDGIIIQDMGVFQAIGEWFPDLPRHISTQMTITGSLGAAYMKQLGAERIVPARELSLEEIKDIKDNVNIEIEAFIHGAMCYCYSGQCLFSSIIGGRSGNRGRCAQPCRLPYEGGIYPLSLKDMCTIGFLPEIIEAGIDSLKIEGRMKSPEYAAGVTALYRKYIDRYYAGDFKEDYQVEEEDINSLKSLYIRSEIGEGYYHRSSGREMVTFDNPSYAERNDILAEEIRKKYVVNDKQYRLEAKGQIRLYKNEPSRYTVACKGLEVSILGDIVQQSVKQPLSSENVIRQLSKSGNTVFDFKEIKTDIGTDVFMPVKSLNNLRRMACEALEKEIIEQNGFFYSDRDINSERNINSEKIKCQEEPVVLKETEATSKFHALVCTWEQFFSLKGSGLSRIYMEADLFTEEDNENYRKLSNREYHQGEPDIYIALPHIIRKKDEEFLRKTERLLQKDIFAGVLVRNYEELQWLADIGYDMDIVTDTHLYLWNKRTYYFYKKQAAKRIGDKYLPYELNLHEINELAVKTDKTDLAQVVYGRIPMMISANCIARTMGKCRKPEKAKCNQTEWLTDRMNKKFPVNLNCRHCYNVIYNSLPLSLHQSIGGLETAGIHTFRLDFTVETGGEAKQTVEYFRKYKSSENDNTKSSGKGDGNQPPYKQYTNGHLKRGVK